MGSPGMVSDSITGAYPKKRRRRVVGLHRAAELATDSPRMLRAARVDARNQGERALNPHIAGALLGQGDLRAGCQAAKKRVFAWVCAPPLAAALQAASATSLAEPEARGDAAKRWTERGVADKARRELAADALADRLFGAFAARSFRPGRQRRELRGLGAARGLRALGHRDLGAGRGQQGVDHPVIEPAEPGVPALFSATMDLLHAPGPRVVARGQRALLG